MDQLFPILVSEYNTEDKISKEFDPVVNRDTTCIKI